MRVIAATFKDRISASRTLKVLRGAFELGDDDAELAPLGVAGTECADSIVLAGRFKEARVETVCELVERNGGNVVVDVDETMTRRRGEPRRVEEPNGRHALSAARGDQALFH